jgi:hypothetical protein
MRSRVPIPNRSPAALIDTSPAVFNLLTEAKSNSREIVSLEDR